MTCGISKSLANIIKESIQTDIFPNMLKIARIKTIYKRGDKSCFNNCRLILLLPAISKIFERVLHTQLFNYLIFMDLVHNNQQN